MSRADMIVAMIVAVNVVVGLCCYVVERSMRRRLDVQASRLAEIEHHIGLTPLFPFDVECPICHADVREPCHGGYGAHMERFDASPGAARVVIERHSRSR